ncbi:MULTISPECIES: hypothetical protein [unclassified Rhizobium]|uniref:hypothetical protein n=1 Tax=unclassified Rhizobium TaxID=2613769 RepID=UPI0007EC09FD|nr:MULTISPECIES: hypothetical protein [unclassified Rhizobium]ANM08619.1 hypothetical protein AMK05_CH00172 [Rhizobium sp. N324]ANM15130.1 hypothetical protein AMK06_CH00173 [Rhizobium sp. N541]ANM21518.1 hypothetical protein AMK07_CH00173 [Rhizobium sp. N941]OWV91266.1 hypothetical protein ATY75_13885 [Rhizobium sp. N122]OYD02182.1 hypothetical protein AMK08_CH100167 [Rhizobium sp. N4311]
MAMPPAIHFANERFTAETFADVISAETFADAHQSARSGLLRLVIGFLRNPRGSRPKLDLESTPDSLKRDLGFMDGRGPRRENRFPV